jgi:hypothetical protein
MRMVIKEIIRIEIMPIGRIICAVVMHHAFVVLRLI